MNPYRKHMDKIQTMARQASREFLYTSPYDKRQATSGTYNMNFVMGSGGEPVDTEFTRRLDSLMKEATGVPDPEIV